jgi:hypothetical protein
MNRRFADALAACGLALALGAAVPALAAHGTQLVISKLAVLNRTNLRANVPYQASINIKTPGPAVSLQKLCFFWNTEGPFCFPNFDMQKGADGRTHPTIWLYTGRPGTYTLTAMVIYTFQGSTYETNQTATTIIVH